MKNVTLKFLRVQQMLEAISVICTGNYEMSTNKKTLTANFSKAQPTLAGKQGAMVTAPMDRLSF